MRHVVLVPLVHDEADLGSAGPALLAETIRIAGPGRWAEHTEALTCYWAEVSTFLHSLDPARLKLFQDGLPVGGSLGRSVVEEAARRGSRNYRLLLDLIDRGAELCRTEDTDLLRQEYDAISQAAGTHDGSRTLAEGAAAEGSAADADGRARLLRERDEFIAQTIDASLQDGEIGVLFLGAEHQATARLAPDILVHALKDPELVRSYFQMLLAGGHERERAQLTRYLMAPIDAGARTAITDDTAS